AVLLDACHHAACQFQSRTARSSAGTRFASSAHGLEKRLELRMQRLYVGRRQFFKRKLRLRSWPLYADAERVAPRVIERNVLMLLEKPHLTHAFGRNPAGRHVSDRAARELQPNMS